MSNSFVVTIPLSRINHLLCDCVRKKPDEIIMEQLSPILISDNPATQDEDGKPKENITITHG